MTHLHMAIAPNTIKALRRRLHENSKTQTLPHPRREQHCHPEPQPPAELHAPGKLGHRLRGRASGQSDVRPGEEKVKVHAAKKPLFFAKNNDFFAH